MIKQFGGFEDIGEAAQEAGGAVVKTVQKQAQNAVKTAVGQVTGNQSQNSSPNNQNGTNEQAAAAKQQMSDDQAKQFLKDLYGPSKPQDRSLPNNQNQNSNQTSQSQNQKSNPVADALGLPQSDPNKGKSPQDLAEIESLRRQLHSDYYQTLTRPKQREETVMAKLEREDQEKQMKEIEEEKKKPQALPQTVKQGTGEKMVGVSG